MYEMIDLTLDSKSLTQSSSKSFFLGSSSSNPMQKRGKAGNERFTPAVSSNFTGLTDTGVATCITDKAIATIMTLRLFN